MRGNEIAPTAVKSHQNQKWTWLELYESLGRIKTSGAGTNLEIMKLKLEQGCLSDSFMWEYEELHAGALGTGHGSAAKSLNGLGASLWALVSLPG